MLDTDATYCDRLNPIINSNVNDIVCLTRAPVKEIDAAVVAASDNGPTAVMEGDIPAPSLGAGNRKCFQSICC